MKKVTGKELEELKTGKNIILVDFGAESWCNPCRILSKQIEPLISKYPDVEFVKIDVEEESEDIKKYNIRSIPTVIIYHGGVVMDISTGVKPNNYYESILDSL